MYVNRMRPLPRFLRPLRPHHRYRKFHIHLHPDRSFRRRTTHIRMGRNIRRPLQNTSN